MTLPSPELDVKSGDIILIPEGSALGSDDVTINDSTAYTVKVRRKQRSVTASVGSAGFTYNSTSDFDTGQSGFYSDKTAVTFDDVVFYDGTSRDPKTPRISGLAQASISSGKLSVQTSNTGGEVLDTPPPAPRDRSRSDLRTACLTPRVRHRSAAARQGSRTSPTTTTWSRLRWPTAGSKASGSATRMPTTATRSTSTWPETR